MPALREVTLNVVAQMFQMFIGETQRGQDHKGASRFCKFVFVPGIAHRFTGGTIFNLTN